MKPFSTIRTVGAQFRNANGQMSGIYSYFVPEGVEPKVGDLIITSFESDDGGDYHARQFKVADVKVARICTVDRVPAPKATRFFLMHLPVEQLQAQATKNKELVERVAEHRNIMERLDVLLLEQAKLDHYKMLAQSNPEAKKLLEQLEA